MRMASNVCSDVEVASSSVWLSPGNDVTCATIGNSELSASDSVSLLSDMREITRRGLS